MEQVKSLLEAREKKLKQWKKEKEKALENAPEGLLRINYNSGRAQYYLRKDPKDASGTYIPRKEGKFVNQLAQKDYDQKILRTLEKELKAIDRFMKDYPEKNSEQIYESLHPARQPLITPIQLPLEEYIRKWEAIDYEGKGFENNAIEYYTQKGERVRSKSEVIIADSLLKEHIPYRYEYPAYLKGFGRMYPDFTVLNTRTRKEMLWEHLGMMDDAEYADCALRKLAGYEKNGIFPGENLILTYETRKTPLDQKIIKIMIEHYLK